MEPEIIDGTELFIISKGNTPIVAVSNHAFRTSSEILDSYCEQYDMSRIGLSCSYVRVIKVKEPTYE